MAVESLDHYTINTADLEASVRFYEEVLGFASGERPAFTFPGAWLYCGEKPVVHLVGGKSSVATGTGSVDHIAFRAADIGGFRARLGTGGVDFHERQVPDMPLSQIFLTDPDGVVIELNFWQE